MTSREEQLVYHGPLPDRVKELPTKEQMKPHALAGRSNGVRSTSRQAYKSIKTTLGPKQAELLRIIQSARRPACDAEMTKALGWPISSLVARRNELVEMGKIEEAFRAVNPATGKRVIYWKCSDGGN